MSKHQRTVSKRLSRTIILLAAPLFILVLGVFYQHANRLLHKEAIEKSTTVLTTTEKLVENYIGTIESAAKSNAWIIEEKFIPDSIQAVTRRIINLNRSVLSCSVSTEPGVFPEYGEYFSVYTVNDGDTIISVIEPEFDYFEKNWYKKPMQTGRPCWINPFSDFNKGIINHHDAVGSYCIPLRPHGGRIAGVISVDFAFQTLRQTVLATNHPYPNSYYMILGPSGGYLVHPESSLLFKNTIFSTTDSVEHPDIIALGREMTANHQGTMHVKFGKEMCHVCYMPVGDTGWSIALVCQESDVLEDYNYLAISMIVIVVVGLIIILLITRKVVRRTIGPLHELMEATDRIAEGDYNTVIPLSDHKDVVGKLQNAFRKMQMALIKHSEQVKQTTEAIEKENTEMEQALPLAKEVSGRRQAFVHGVKHQINQPINIINGLANVLQNNIFAQRDSAPAKGSVKSEELHSITKTMKHNAVFLHRTTLMLYDSSDLRLADTSRYERNDRVSCNELVRDNISRTLTFFNIKDIHFESELQDSFSIKTNKLYLTNTIRELIYNAASYSDGEHITVRVAKTETSVQFIIEDVGPGLPENSEELIFIPFAKGDDLSQGLGLGLPLCKGHAKSLGGDLIHDTSYKQGCRFILEIPIAFHANE